MFCPRQKNNIQDYQNQRYISTYFFVPKRERGRESKSESESESKSKSRKGKGKGKERERTEVLVMIFLNRPCKNEKSGNYTVLYMKERYSMYS
jgi:hypothetical protein